MSRLLARTSDHEVVRRFPRIEEVEAEDTEAGEYGAGRRLPRASEYGAGHRLPRAGEYEAIYRDVVAEPAASENESPRTLD